jgi:hypothetical protein
VAVREQVPTETNVITPTVVTVHTSVVVDAYETVKPELALAPGTGGVALKAVLVRVGKVIDCEPCVSVND